MKRITQNQNEDENADAFCRGVHKAGIRIGTEEITRIKL